MGNQGNASGGLICKTPGNDPSSFEVAVPNFVIMMMTMIMMMKKMKILRWGTEYWIGPAEAAAESRPWKHAAYRVLDQPSNSATVLISNKLGDDHSTGGCAGGVGITLLPLAREESPQIIAITITIPKPTLPTEAFCIRCIRRGGWSLTSTPGRSPLKVSVASLPFSLFQRLECLSLLRSAFTVTCLA
ncbi:uncharacterized protein BO80DRAFT_198645 [Aspergillus ibericus CBS 121593]|uniref:Uncharacterized protein n=1 Tax=Aspergillus ibericus CBS 121593 TaxID=1448316 RepID=A0A395GQC9_9EURO|nr:hypothetical protein BO80DRAFT_198645 [Aspergillus ibericus CBS 121593]RAK97138.1 hypothetical protein BO80DRAFT_198645 [Aspergillus ibericus CBS 121593]